MNIVLRAIRKVLRKKRFKKQKKAIMLSMRSGYDFSDKDVFDAEKYGFIQDESYLFNLKDNDYRDYISTWESFQPRIKDNKMYYPISDDKYLFSLVFGRFVSVPKTYALINHGVITPIDAEGINVDGLYDFLLENGGGVIKDRRGCNGIDVYVLKKEDDILLYKGKPVSRDEIGKIVSEFQEGIIQSIIKQGKFENELNDKSINTIRIVSMKKPDGVEHEPVIAMHRIGTAISSPVDNFHQGGLSALIDMETGELGSAAGVYYFENDKPVFYDNHPESNVQIKGRVIPGWKKIKEQIVDITRKLPFFDYIAWDIALGDDGITVIETNMKSGLDAFQIHKGMRDSYLGQKYREHGYLEEMK